MLSSPSSNAVARQHSSRKALVLMGGGARTAYQAGFLQAIEQILSKHSADQPVQALPFQILAGTSAGALNASFIASRAQLGLPALDALAQFWMGLRSSQVYRLDVPSWMKFSRLLTAWYLSRQVRNRGALLDSLPMADTMHKVISLAGIDASLTDGALEALAVTAASYTHGVHWTFCHTRHDTEHQQWSRPNRRIEFQQVTMEHLMASSAIPLIFPAMPLWVDGHREYFGDGSMRQTSPLSAAMHLGADKILVIGVGQPARKSSAEGGASPVEQALRPAIGKNSAPSVGGILGYALSSVFHDTLRSDIEQAQRMNETLSRLQPELAQTMPYRRVEVMSVEPSRSLDDMAVQFFHALPSELRSVLSALAGKKGQQGLSKGTGAALASYLLFEPEFVQPLMALGREDALAQKDALLAFFCEA